MMDYAFVPGITPWELSYRKLLDLRPDTVRYPAPGVADTASLANPMTMLSQFFARLQSDLSSSSQPARSLLLCAHGNDDRLAMLLSPAHADHIQKVGQRSVAYYEDIAHADTTGGIRIPSSILPPGAFVHVKGCLIGLARPYLQRLKQALGGQIYLTAPKYEDMVLAAPPDGSGGFFEYLAHNCRVYRKTLGAADMLPVSATNAEIDSAGLAVDFDQLHLKQLDGTQVPYEFWKQIIPSKIKTPLIKPRLNVKFSPNPGPAWGGYYFPEGQYRYDEAVDLVVDVSVPSPPADFPNGLTDDAAKQILTNYLAANDARFSPDPTVNPFPMDAIRPERHAGIRRLAELGHCLGRKQQCVELPRVAESVLDIVSPRPHHGLRHAVQRHQFHGRQVQLFSAIRQRAAFILCARSCGSRGLRRAAPWPRLRIRSRYPAIGATSPRTAVRLTSRRVPLRGISRDAPLWPTSEGPIWGTSEGPIWGASRRMRPGA
jgi:hypothetical protein